MSDNYIMLNGKRVDLTEEQLEKLGLKVEKKDDCFKKGKEYYFISNTGSVIKEPDTNYWADIDRYKVANYCTDKALMQQRALHETLDRLLWRFSMQNDWDKIDWSNTDQVKYYICFRERDRECDICNNLSCKNEGTTYFHTEKTAQRAIDEIVLPFMKEHPEFVW